MTGFDGVHNEGVASWSEFKAHLYERIGEVQRSAFGVTQPQRVDPKKFVFRGHGGSDWLLEASYDRKVRALYATSPFDLDEEYSKRLNNFVIDCEYYGINDDVPGTLTPKDYLEQRGQHHGLPTRLLDWTASPYIAAFFAMSDSFQSKTGLASIWALDVENLQISFRKEDLHFIRNPITNNPRMRMQMGSFTRNSTNLSTLEEVFAFSNRRFKNIPKYPIAYKFDIPVSEGQFALQDLYTMGIDYIRLFPGIEGLCKAHQAEIDRM